MWRHIDVQADWRRSWTYGRAPNAIDISQGSLTCPSKHRHGTTLFIRWFRHTAPFSRLLRSRWGYGGHILDLTPGPSRGNELHRSLWLIRVGGAKTYCAQYIFISTMLWSNLTHKVVVQVQTFKPNICHGHGVVLRLSYGPTWVTACDKNTSRMDGVECFSEIQGKRCEVILSTRQPWWTSLRVTWDWNNYWRIRSILSFR